MFVHCDNDVFPLHYLMLKSCISYFSLIEFVRLLNLIINLYSQPIAENKNKPESQTIMSVQW